MEQNLIDWLLAGGALTSNGAALGIGALIAMFIMPVAKYLAERFKWNFAGTLRTQAVYVMGISVSLTVGWLTKSVESGAVAVAVGVQAALIAMGLYETGNQAVKAAVNKQMGQLNWVATRLSPLKPVERPFTPLDPEAITPDPSAGPDA